MLASSMIRVLLLAAALVAPAAAAVPTHRAKLPDGRRLAITCAGSGTPVVVLETGYAAPGSAWKAVQAKVARETRVCSYDRAGYGASDAGPLPRDADATARDLWAGLADARLKPPYVLAGHSAGGLYVRRFADLHPGAVVGMVLVDPSIEDQRERFAATGVKMSTGGLRAHAARCLAAAEAKTLPSAEPGLERCTPKSRGDALAARDAERIADALRPERWRAQVSELDSLWTTTAASVAGGRASYGAMPLVVLTAGANYPTGSPAAGVWREAHAALAARSSRGRAEVVEGAPHMMMQARPDVVAAAIIEVVEMARK